MGEDQDNGFVERPTVVPRQHSVMARLRQTADNGKAIVLRRYSGGYSTVLGSQGYRVHTARQRDGTVLAWCERIDAASPASRPEGARP